MPTRTWSSAVHEHLPPQHEPFLDLRAAAGRAAHAAPLRVPEDRGRLQQQVQLLHHPGAARQAASAGRIDDGDARGGAPGERGRQGAAGDLAGHQRLRGRPALRAAAAGAASTTRRASSTWRAALGELGVWVRLHYVYPYPHVDAVIPLMAERRVLPYLDIPFQHGSASVLKRMRRPAHAVDTLARIRAWRARVPGPDPAQHLHRRLPRGDRGGVRASCWRGSMRRSSTGSAASSTHPWRAPPPTRSPITWRPQVQEERYARFMERAAQISAQRLARARRRTHAGAGG